MHNSVWNTHYYTFGLGLGLGFRLGLGLGLGLIQSYNGTPLSVSSWQY